MLPSTTPQQRNSPGSVTNDPFSTVPTAQASLPLHPPAHVMTSLPPSSFGAQFTGKAVFSPHHHSHAPTTRRSLSPSWFLIVTCLFGFVVFVTFSTFTGGGGASSGGVLRLAVISSIEEQQRHSPSAPIRPPFPDSNSTFSAEEQQKQDGHRQVLSSSSTSEEAIKKRMNPPPPPPLPFKYRPWVINDNHGRLAPQPHVDDLTMDRQKPTPYNWDEAVMDQIVSLAANVDPRVKFAPLAENSFTRGTQWKRAIVGTAETSASADNAKESGINPKTGLPWRRFANQFRDPSDTVEIRFGVLTIARFVNTRLLPMLNTSLLHATSVDVFIRKTNVSYAVADYIRASVRQFHPHWRGIRVVELYGPLGADEDENDNKADSQKNQTNSGDSFTFPPANSANGVQFHNIWQNLEIMRYWRTEYDLGKIGAHTSGGAQEDPSSSSDRSDSRRNNQNRNEWYCIMDDDGYVLLDSAKAMLWDIEQYERFEPYDTIQADSKREYEAILALINRVKTHLQLSLTPQFLKQADTNPIDPRVSYRERLMKRILGRQDSSSEQHPPSPNDHPPDEPATVNRGEKRGVPQQLAQNLLQLERIHADSPTNLRPPLRPIITGAFYVINGDPIINGGPGYYFNRAALATVTDSHYKHCLSKYRNSLGGDIIASMCMQEAGVKLHRTYHASIFDPKMALTASLQPVFSPYPCAFHKIKDGVHVLHMLRRLEEMRAARGELVHWDDIILNFNRTIPLNSTEYYADIVTPAPKP